jgi:hypothetical protein
MFRKKFGVIAALLIAASAVSVDEARPPRLAASFISDGAAADLIFRAP